MKLGVIDGSFTDGTVRKIHFVELDEKSVGAPVDTVKAELLKYYDESIGSLKTSDESQLAEQFMKIYGRFADDELPMLGDLDIINLVKLLRPQPEEAQ